MRVLLLLTASTAMAATSIKWGEVPLSFEPNTGQTAAQVRYLARGSRYTLYFADGQTTVIGQGDSALRMRFVGANGSSSIVAEDPQESKTNYFVGNDPSRWRTSIPNYGKIRYAGVYAGIDLLYYGRDGNLEYDWIVSPSADPRQIRLVFDGAGRIRIDKHGDLVVKIGKNEYRHRKPSVYQNVAGMRSPVAGMWKVRGKEAGFDVGSYDRTAPLVIDPVLIYSTYLGGSASDSAYAIAVDNGGNTYVTGSTGSTDFPVNGPVQGALRGVGDAFVTKFNASGSARVYSTYLGSGGVDQGNGIAVDAQGNVYITGAAGFSDFPTVGAIQGTWGGSGDAFVTKLAADGASLVYSTYLGGNASDSGTAIAVDGSHNAYVIGITFSSNFPTVNAYQTAKGSQQDAFVAKINPAGTALVYCTYLGGNGADEGYAIAADASGSAYVTGYTASTNFPLQSPIRSSNLSTIDAFVTKINPAGSALAYSTYLGGGGTDYGTGIAVDSAGNAYITGPTSSGDFPVVNGTPHASGVNDDAFVTKINASGSSLVYSTCVGGGSNDEPYAIAIDQTGNAYITGRTNSSDFPLTNAIQGGRFAFDIFVTELNASGSARIFSTFLGGMGSESGRGIAVDRLSNIHVAGEGTSSDFPVVNAVQSRNGGTTNTQDGLVLLIGNAAWPGPGSALGFYPITPCRAVDTRASQGKTGGFGPPSLTPYAARDFHLLASGCGIDAAVEAYSLNFTAVPPGPLDFLSAWPTGQSYPGVSTLNSSDHSTLANAAIVPAGANNSITVAGGEATDLIIDANGYFALPNGSDLSFYVVTPCRVADTRSSQPFTGSFGPPSLVAGGFRDFPIQMSSCHIPATAEAYSLNMTVIPQAALPYLSTWPTGQPYPNVSTLNSNDGSIIANAAIVPAGTPDGSVRVLSGGNTDLIIDINGYFGPPGGPNALHFYTVSPCRVADTRSSQGFAGAFGPPSLVANGTRQFPVTTSVCGIPSTARAYSLNFTAVPSGSLPFLSVWPSGSAYPNVSTLNSPKGTVLANAAIVPAGSPSGGITVLAGGATDLIIDINGYFAP